ncbi:unnamed protein product [Meloidogyne enterolobii]|uniref:Uncharacterized protein n=1 Tax=Meloidogyne enterolobii TaxID=390850 RepID=A0ACB1AUJ8_MELEN
MKIEVDKDERERLARRASLLAKIDDFEEKIDSIREFIDNMITFHDADTSPLAKNFTTNEIGLTPGQQRKLTKFSLVRKI